MAARRASCSVVRLRTSCSNFWSTRLSASPSARTNACSESAIWVRRARISSTSWTIFVMQGSLLLVRTRESLLVASLPIYAERNEGKRYLCICWAKPQTRCAGATRSKLANQPHQFALNIDLVRAEDARLIVGIGRLEGDRSAFFAQALEGGLLLFNQGHDHLAVHCFPTRLSYDHEPLRQ